MRFIKLGSFVLLVFIWTVIDAFAGEAPDPCQGPAALFSLVNRPSVADSACVVPFEKGLIESGVQYQNLKGGKRSYIVPQAELRLGLPAKTELAIIFPSYTHQTQPPHGGWGPAVVGLKHELGYNEKWLGSVEGLVILPSGSEAFGSDGLGGTINGIVDYNITNSLNLTFMLGISTQTQPYGSGGQRFNTINPDLLLAWQVNDKLQTYAEVYGQSKTSPTSGAGFNADAGIQYLFTPTLVSDLEAGQRISGQLGQFNNYFGAGLSWLF